MSWRNETAPETQQDLDGLLNATLPFAEEQLTRYGEFFPFGAAVAVDGTVGMRALDTEDEDRPSSTSVVGGLIDGLRSQREELRAAAVASMVTVDGGDAVRVELEHRDGQSMVVMLPYRKRRLRGLQIGELSAAPSDGLAIWS